MNKEHNMVTRDAATIVDRALHYIDSEYGKCPEAASELSYHNGLHSRYVVVDLLALADALKLDSAAKAIGWAAAGSHDIVQGTGRGSDEAQSADWLVQRAAESGNFAPFQIEIGRLAVIGTEPIFENGQMVAQAASQLDYPTRLHERVAKLVASADLGRLYTLDGPYLSHRLYQEINGGQPPTDLAELLPFQRDQISFLEQYTYPSAEAGTLLSSHKSKVVDYDEKLIVDIETGRLETWQQLIDRDQALRLSY